jgi:serine/threonine protein kinase
MWAAEMAKYLQPDSLFAADFRVVRVLGHGGMGTVYVAEQLSTGKLRALKLMLPALVSDPASRRRFEQEARIGARIESDHVVDVVGAGVDAETEVPWLAMELLHGEDLASVVVRRGALPVEEVRGILKQLCHAIGAAHDVGIVHRDLKPENIFLSQAKRADARTTVKVLDFGIAKWVADARSTASAAIGSPSWMAPEQTARGGVIGPMTDVWAIGLIAFDLLTGHCYWRSAEDESSTLANLLREVVLEPMPPASARAAELGVTLPPGFDAWFSRAVDRDPNARFATARDAHAAFEGLFAATTLSPTLLQTQIDSTIGPGHTLIADAPAFIPRPSSTTASGLAASAKPRTFARIYRYLAACFAFCVLLGLAFALIHRRRATSGVTAAASASATMKGNDTGPDTNAVPSSSSNAEAVKPPPSAAAATSAPPPPSSSASARVIEATSTRTAPSAARVAPAATRSTSGRDSLPPSPFFPATTSSAPSLPSQPAAAGFLDIDTLPGSNCYVDGRLLGPTPLRRIAVAPGAHTLRFVDMRGGAEGSMTVSVAAGETRAVFRRLRGDAEREREREREWRRQRERFGGR